MISKQSIITLVGLSILILFALTVISFVPRTPAVEAQAPSMQGQNEPSVSIEMNTYNGIEEYGNSLYARFTFTNFQDITCDKNDGGTHHTAFDDPCYFQSEVHRRPPESGRVSQCEGLGMGGPRSFSKGTGVRRVIDYSLNPTSSSCPVGLYVLKVKLKESDKTVVASASANFEIIPAQPTNTPAPTATPTYTRVPPTNTPTVTPNPPTATPTATKDESIQNSPPGDPVPTATPTATPTTDDSIQNSPPGDPVPTATPTPTMTNTPMPPPSVRISGLPSAFDQGQQTSFDMVFAGIDDSDQYGYRADVTSAGNSAADSCEGTGVGGSGQYTAQLTGAVNGKITLPGAIDANCPSGNYTLTVTILAASGFSYTATQGFHVNGVSLAPIATDTPTPTATNTPEPTATKTNTPEPAPTATATNPPRQQQPPQQKPTATNTPKPAPTNTNTPAPTKKVSYSSPPQQKQPAPTATPTPTATATPRPTLTPTVTPTDDAADDFPDRIISVVDDQDTDSDADTGTATPAQQTTSTDDDSGSDWPGHYAAGRSVWSCQELSDLVNSLAALRRTMTVGSYPQAVTQPEIMNARLGPGLAYDVITTLPQNTRANIIGVDPRGEWYQLELSHLDIPVWIYRSLATVEGSLADVRQVPAAELSQLPISGAPGSRPLGITRSEVMNVRLGPGFDYAVLTTLPHGTEVEVIGIAPSGEWLQVELEGMRSLGWLYRDLVEVDCPLVNVRRITEREISLEPAALTQPYALHAYSGPGLAYDRVAILPRGTWAEIIAIGDCPPNVWYQIIVPGLDEPVWVVRDFVKVAIGSLAGLPLYGVNDFTPPAADERPIAVTQPATLNLRTGPGLEHDVVAEAPRGTQGRIYGTDPSERWLLVEIDGHSSLVWVYRHMTQVKGSLVGVRRLTAPELTVQPAVLIQPHAVFGSSGPGTEYAAVTILPKGAWARVVGIGPRSEWLLVQVAGMDGPVWVLCDLLKIIGSLAGVPQLWP